MTEQETNTRITVEFKDLHPRIFEFARREMRPLANAVVYLCARGLEKEAEERRQASLSPSTPAASTYDTKA